ncbi:hypothetical protein ACLOJK_039169 [Asimina triloba]
MDAAGSGLLYSPSVLGKMQRSPKNTEDAIARDGLQLRRIRTGAVVVDLLDDLDRSHGASSMVVLAGS